MFRTALAGLAADLGRPVRARDVAMVGDDPVQDIAGARRVGLRGILVLTGKTGAAAAASLEDAAAPGVGARRSRAIPDAVAPSLADVVAALD
jgi:ribonucleotide monophosphatase NagD (HAD superfamily)